MILSRDSLSRLSGSSMFAAAHRPSRNSVDPADRSLGLRRVEQAQGLAVALLVGGLDVVSSSKDRQREA